MKYLMNAVAPVVIGAVLFLGPGSALAQRHIPRTDEQIKDQVEHKQQVRSRAFSKTPRPLLSIIVQPDPGFLSGRRISCFRDPLRTESECVYYEVCRFLLALALYKDLSYCWHMK